MAETAFQSPKGDERESNVIRELEERSWAQLETNIDPDDLEELATAFAEILEDEEAHPPPPDDYIAEHYDPEEREVRLGSQETDQLNDWHLYRARGSDGMGYTSRRHEKRVRHERGLDADPNSAGASDPKEHFHYVPGLKEELTELHEQNGWGAVPPAVLELLDLAQPLHARTAEVLQGAIRDMEHNVAYRGIYNQLFRDNRWLEISPLRVLLYRKVDNPISYPDDSVDGVWSEDGASHQTLGKFHWDKSDIGTIAHKSPRKGIRVAKRPTVQYSSEEGGGFWMKDEDMIEALANQMELVELPDGSAMYLMPTGFRRTTGINEPWTEASGHDIINAEGPEFRDQFGRWAIVFFGNTPEGIAAQPSKNQTHGAQY